MVSTSPEAKARRNAKALEYYYAHKDEPGFLEARKAYKQAHKEEIKQQRADYQRMSLKANREAVIAHYGGCCACCGEDRYEFLAVDHIEGNGREDRDKGLSGSNMINYLIRNNFPEGYRILCHNCNMALGMYGCCPHHPDVSVNYGVQAGKKWKKQNPDN